MPAGERLDPDHGPPAARLSTATRPSLPGAGLSVGPDRADRQAVLNSSQPPRTSLAILILKVQNVLQVSNAAQHEFIEDMGQHMVGWGVPRNTGRVYAYLLLATEPASLDRLSAELGMAKSGASVAARQLVGFGMARAIGQRGSRRTLYEALHSIEGIFAARNARAGELLARLRQGARAAPPGIGRQRLADMADTMDELIREMPAMIQRIRDRRRS